MKTIESYNVIDLIYCAVNRAMTKKLRVSGYYDKDINYFHFQFLNNGHGYASTICPDYITLDSPTGWIKTDHKLSKQENLRLQGLLIEVEAYQESRAISEFDEFINEEDYAVPATINDLDNEDD